MNARLDSTMPAKVDELAKCFHRPRAAVLCYIMPWGLSRAQTGIIDQGKSGGQVRHLYLYVECELGMSADYLYGFGRFILENAGVGAIKTSGSPLQAFSIPLFDPLFGFIHQGQE
jgi:hypothetical protein